MQAKGNAEGWDNHRKWQEFLKGISSDALAQGMKELSPAEVGLVGLITQKLHWTSATSPAPLPRP